MPNIGGWELFVVLVIVMVVFGAGKLPGIAKDLAGGLKEFKKEVGSEEDT